MGLNSPPRHRPSRLYPTESQAYLLLMEMLILGQQIFASIEEIAEKNQREN